MLSVDFIRSGWSLCVLLKMLSVDSFVALALLFSHFDSWNTCFAILQRVSDNQRIPRERSIPPDVKLQLVPHSSPAMIWWGVYLT